MLARRCGPRLRTGMSDRRPLIVVAHPLLGFLIGRLADRYEPLPLWEEEDWARLAEVRVLVVAGEFRIDPALIAAMPKLGLIACFSVGYDGIDVPAMRARGIAVTHAQDANSEDAADHAVGLILAHRREIVRGEVPFGRLLRDYGVDYRSRPTQFLAVTPNSEMMGAFWMREPLTLYGRQTEVSIENLTIGEIVEILPPA